MTAAVLAAPLRPLTPASRKEHTGEAWCSTRRKAPEHNREWGRADPVAAPKTPAAPATVSGEGLRSATGPRGPGRPETPSEPRARRPAVHVLRPRPSGVTAR